MTTTEKLSINTIIGLHNLGLVSDAKKLLKSFVGDGEGLVYIHNPDGTWLKLQPGFEITAVDGLGITKEEW